MHSLIWIVHKIVRDCKEFDTGEADTNSLETESRWYSNRLEKLTELLN